MYLSTQSRVIPSYQGDSIIFHNENCSPSGKPSGLQACIHPHKDRKESTTPYNKRERGAFWDRRAL